MLEERVGCGDGGCGTELVEDGARLVEHGVGLGWLAEAEEAAALALEGIGVFWDDAELFPALGSVSVAGGGGLVVAACFGERGGGGGEGVVGVGRSGLIVGGELVGDAGWVEGDGGPDEGGEQRGVGGVVARVGGSCEFAEQCGSATAVSEGGVGDGGCSSPMTKSSASPASRLVVSTQSRWSAAWVGWPWRVWMRAWTLRTSARFVWSSWRRSVSVVVRVRAWSSWPASNKGLSVLVVVMSTVWVRPRAVAYAIPVCSSASADWGPSSAHRSTPRLL